MILESEKAGSLLGFSECRGFLEVLYTLETVELSVLARKQPPFVTKGESKEGSNSGKKKVWRNFVASKKPMKVASGDFGHVCSSKNR